MRKSSRKSSLYNAISPVHAATLAYREMLAFVTVKNGKAIGEAVQKRLPGEDFARDAHLRVNVPLV